MIENDLEEPFHCGVPVSANFVNYKEGIHFKLVDKVFVMLDEIEKVEEKRKEYFSIYKESIKISNIRN